MDEHSIRRALWRGALRGRKYKRQWRISLSAINRYKIGAR
ncbi:MAG: hypothetical protein D4R81_05915 [Nitrospiraceae bacterium]|nr:MAG: hypothetical protein D4R81_05915 [Nitrospiraceae bacterium]